MGFFFLLLYVVAFVAGGVTAIPLFLVGAWWLSKKVGTSKKAREEQRLAQKEAQARTRGLPEGYGSLKTTEFYYRNDLDVNTAFSGWLTVTSKFYELPQIESANFKPNANANANFNDPSGSGENGGVDSTGFMRREPGSVAAAAAGAKQLRQVRIKNRYYGVVRHGNLFLYKDETEADVQHAIVLSQYHVTLWPTNLTDAQLFTKRSAICLVKKEVSQADTTRQLSTKEILYMLQKGNPRTTSLPAGSCFLYGDTNCEKEDWYFALLRATSKPDARPQGSDEDQLDPSLNAKPLFFLTSDIMELVQTLNATEGQLTTKWLNALLGRLFLGVYRTHRFQQAIKARVEKKLRKIRTPGFLDELQIGHISGGYAAPFFSSPKLNHLSPEGDLEIESVVDYAGGLTVEIATKVVLNLGSHFKQREFDVNLKVVVRKLHGTVLAGIKPMPSNRLWYTFKTMPEIDLDIQPVVSSRAINYNLVVNMLDKRFKEAIRTSLVHPFMDDIVFFNTSDEMFRGGIWDHTALWVPPAAPNGAEKTVVERRVLEKGVPPPPTLTVNTDDVDDVVSAQSSNGSTLSKTRNRLKLTKSGASSLVENSELAAVQIKNGVSTGVSKLKQWYSKRSTSNPEPKTPVTPPEMITNRRKRDSSVNAHANGLPSSPNMFISEKFRANSMSRAASSLEGSVAPSLPPKDPEEFTQSVRPDETMLKFEIERRLSSSYDAVQQLDSQTTPVHSHIPGLIREQSAEQSGEVPGEVPVQVPELIVPAQTSPTPENRTISHRRPPPLPPRKLT